MSSEEVFVATSFPHAALISILSPLVNDTFSHNDCDNRTEKFLCEKESQEKKFVRKHCDSKAPASKDFNEVLTNSSDCLSHDALGRTKTFTTSTLSLKDCDLAASKGILKKQYRAKKLKMEVRNSEKSSKTSNSFEWGKYEQRILEEMVSLKLQ